MLSKGIDYYAYLSESHFGVTFSSPKENAPFSFASSGVVGAMQQGNLQIGESDISWTEHTGRFQWTASQNGKSLANRYAEIAPSTGNLGDSNMGNMLQTPSVVGTDYALSFGFYDAGSAFGLPLTSQDQSYVYLTGNYSNWMGDLVAAIPALSEKSFSVFALPGAHDAGMFDPSTFTKIVSDPVSTAMFAGLFGIVGIKAVPEAVLRAGVNLAFTQKDNITTMLNLGIRYFDFRPGYCYQNLADGIYHQHNFIPGYSYQKFLSDILSWLITHPNEIVVVNLKFDGLANVSMHPAPAVLDQMAESMRKSTAPDILFGDKISLNTSYRVLLEEKKQLIFLNQVGGVNDAKPHDSYSDDSYKTTDVSTILKALENMPNNLPSSYDYTVLQLQGTASAIPLVAVSSALTVSDASSSLLSTKAMFDNQTYPWLIANVPSKFPKDKLIVFLNDFADNALVNHSIETTRQRAINDNVSPSSDDSQTGKIPMNNNINLTNITGQDITIANFSVNNKQLCANGTLILSGATFPFYYDEKGKGWNDFSDLTLEVTLNGNPYHVNLNRDHYFGGNDFHYPGAGSDVNYVLLGTNSSGSQIQFRLAYRQAGAATFLYSSDSKVLDK